MKLLTTTIAYSHVESELAIELFNKLGLPLAKTDDGKERVGYSEFTISDTEFFKYWSVLDRVTHIREV